MKLNAPWVFTLLVAALVGFFVANQNHCFGFKLTPEELGALFTGIGLAGLVATFWHQREDGRTRSTQHADLIARIIAQTDAANAQSVATTRAAYVSALVGSFGAAGSHPLNSLQEKLRGKMETTLALLEKEGNIP